jgi:hypothetical protein
VTIGSSARAGTGQTRILALISSAATDRLLLEKACQQSRILCRADGHRLITRQFVKNTNLANAENN